MPRGFFGLSIFVVPQGGLGSAIFDHFCSDVPRKFYERKSEVIPVCFPKSVFFLKSKLYMWVFPKIMVPPNHPLFNRLLTIIFTIHFGGKITFSPYFWFNIHVKKHQTKLIKISNLNLQGDQILMQQTYGGNFEEISDFPPPPKVHEVWGWQFFLRISPSTKSA